MATNLSDSPRSQSQTFENNEAERSTYGNLYSGLKECLAPERRAALEPAIEEAASRKAA